MPVTNIKSTWSGGDLYFYEGSVGRSATGDVLIIGDDAVTIGGTSQDIDFGWYASGSKSFVLDAGAGTLTIAGLDVSLTGDLTIDTEDLNIGDGDDLEFGDSQDVLMRFSLADTSNPAFVLALDDTSQQMHVTDKGAVATDWARSAGTHPELAIHSNTTPATDYLAIGNHDGTTASIDVIGGTTLAIKIAGTAEVNFTADALAPETSDGNALGTSAKMWSDLFLASEAVINFNNGNATITHSAGLLTLGSAGLSIGASGAGFDVIFYGDTESCNFFWDQNLDTNGGLQLGADTKSVSFYAYGLTTGNYLKWDGANDDFIITGTAARVLHGADGAGNDVIFYGAVASYAITWDANGDTNGSLLVGADTKGIMFNLYGDTTGCGVFWDPSTDTNGTLAVGASGGSKGNDFIAYGTTNGAYVQWDQSADDLIIAGAARFLAGANTVGCDVLLYGAGDGYLVTWDADGDTNGSLLVGADTKGIQVNFYGDVTGCGVFWNPSTDTNGTLTIGGSGGSKGNDFITYGATNGNYLQWDQSADDLILAGTAVQLIVEGDTDASSTTTGSIHTAGGLGVVKKGFFGDDVSLTSLLCTDNVGAANTGVTAVEYGDGHTHITVLTVSQVDALTLGDDAALSDGYLLYTLPAGAVIVERAYMSMAVTAASAQQTGDTPDVGIGTTIGSGIQATLDLVAAAAENIITGQTAGDCNGTATVKTIADQELVIETGGDHTVYFNVADTWGNDSGGDLTANIAGTVVLVWRFMA